MNKKYLDDINYMLTELGKNHINLYFNIRKDKLWKFAFDLLERTEIKNGCDFFYIVNSILKQVNDPHTFCDFLKYRWLPLTLIMIDDRLYILDISKEYSKYKYSEITHINDIELKTLVSELEKTIPYSTEDWLSARMETGFIKIETILSLPSIDSTSDKISYTISKNGKFENLDFDINCQYNFDFVKSNNYSVSIDKDNQYIKVVYSSCKEPEPGIVQKTVDYIDKLARENNITRFVVDLRGNTGGSSRIIKPLIEYLRENSSYLATLVDKNVFSSGAFAVCDLKDIGSISVGTGIGTTMNHFGETIRFALPNSNLRVQYSTKYFCGDHCIHGQKEFNEFISNRENAKYFKPIVFQPDIYVENKIEDYINGKDKELECAVQALSNLSFNKDVRQIK